MKPSFMEKQIKNLNDQGLKAAIYDTAMRLGSSTDTEYTLKQLTFLRMLVSEKYQRVG
jgi:hypothetical protein